MASSFDPDTGNPLIVQSLLDRGVVETSQLASIREALTNKDEESIESMLVRNGYAMEHEIASAYAEQFSLPMYQPAEGDEPVGPELAHILPEKLCREQMIAPVAMRGDVLDMAFLTPQDLLIVDELQLVTGLTVRPLIAPLSVVESVLDHLYNKERPSRSFMAASSGFEPIEDEEPEQQAEEIGEADEVLELDQPPPPGKGGRIIRMVNQILEQAVRSSASDIHLEPFEDNCKLRLRVDGILHELPALSKSLFIMVISRFKILAKMDIAEKRIPQDGAIAIKTAERRIDLRVSTVPTVYGEKMVLRLLDKAAIPLQLTGLGLDERQAKDLIESIQMPYGLLLVTGPTGSGKSTTLYSCLNLLNEPKVNICTVEDPVEYKFKGLNQIQVKSQVGLTFASALRAFLRQDPDIIMVGEVRDPETAQICLRAALTGHFVLSTIHTNDALSAVARLEDMSIEPFLIASTLRCLQAQRLVRRLCKECKQPYSATSDIATRYGIEAGSTLYRPKGCDHCRGTGYRGRVGIFEVIRITPNLAHLIQVRTPLPELREAAVAEGMKMLIHSGIDKAQQGLTSLETVLAVSMTGEE